MTNLRSWKDLLEVQLEKNGDIFQSENLIIDRYTNMNQKFVYESNTCKLNEIPSGFNYWAEDKVYYPSITNCRGIDIIDVKFIEFIPNVLKLYLLTQTINTGLDTYDSMVVCAYNEAIAKRISPNFQKVSKQTKLIIYEYENNWEWASSDNVKCEYLGLASKNTNFGIICSSFNSG